VTTGTFPWFPKEMITYLTQLIETNSPGILFHFAYDFIHIRHGNIVSLLILMSIGEKKRNHVIQNGQAVAFFGFIKPLNPSSAVLGKLQEKFSLTTPMGDLPRSTRSLFDCGMQGVPWTIMSPRFPDKHSSKNGLFAPEKVNIDLFWRAALTVNPAISASFLGPTPIYHLPIYSGALRILLGPAIFELALKHWDRDAFIYSVPLLGEDSEGFVRFPQAAGGSIKQMTIDMLDEDGCGVFERAAGVSSK
jgi:hypothetical protein